jgi:predicted RNase H-like HicB family nuclease
MSAKSTKSSKPSGANAIDRPFAPDVLRRARRLAGAYRILLEADPELGFLGRSVEMPTVLADGPTPTDCVRELREALTAAVATLLELGRRPPRASARARTAQINIRVSQEEKLLLEESARREGFRGVADFIRARTLAAVK